MTPTETPDALPPPSRRARSRFLRFGLRSFFVFAILFCLFFAWAGKHLYRVRQEQVAVEALKQAGAKFSVMGGNSGLSIGWVDAQPFEDYASLSRLFGWTERPVLSMVELKCPEPDDPRAAAATAALAQFPETSSLVLWGSGFDDESLTHLTALPKLEDLILIHTEVGDAGIAELGPPLKLRGLAILEGRSTPESIEVVASRPDLEWLQLSDNALIEPDAYAALEGARKLKFLIAEGSGFDDDDMTVVAKLENLETLKVDGITDVGLARLAPLAKLTWLGVRSPVTKDAARTFSAAHAGCHVVHADARGSTTRFVAGEMVP